MLPKNEIVSTGIHMVVRDRSGTRRCEDITICQTNRKTLPVIPLHPWPWTCVLFNYCGTFQGKMFLLTIGAHSKWFLLICNHHFLDRKVFCYSGFTKVIVSDNAANFTSEEFEHFLKKNDIGPHCIIKPPIVLQTRLSKLLRDEEVEGRYLRDEGSQFPFYI